jgi:acetyl-CoA carboxylase biotin carboxyl carrier protein
LNIKELKEILQLLDENDVSEFELEEGGMKLRVRMTAAASAVAPAIPTLVAPLAPAAVPGLAAASAPAAAPARTAEPPAPVDEDEGLVVVKSPIVGTFYRAPDPNAPPFVSVGDHIKPGQVLCIVEAMKLMNEIEAEAGGTVVKIHPETGQPVQFGDPLFTVRPD